MRKEIQKFHSLTLATYNALMFEQLIHKHNIITETSKVYQFEGEDGEETTPLRGYFALKEVGSVKQKYFITDLVYEQLPVKVNDSEELYYKESSKSKSVIHYATNITPFKIRPEQKWKVNKQFLQDIAPFKHSMPTQWELSKIIAIMSYIGKTFLGVCSLSEFGKSSIYLIMDALTQKCPVFQPRSVPGVLAQITSDGNMVFDEVHDAPSDVKSCMENFSLQVAGNSPVYINGALRSKNTKPKYDVTQQSITYLYNVYGNYSDPEKQFWDHIWSNKKAMQTRFLTLKLEGKLEEDFDKDFNIPQVAEDNKLFYINLAKHLLYLKNLKISHKYVLRWQTPNRLSLSGRHKILYDEILWGIDLFTESQEEYIILVESLNKCVNDYKDMIGYKQSQIIVEEVQ